MARSPWNHNIAYYPVIWDAIPSNGQRALDAGCGEGLLARQLAQRCESVTAIDLHPLPQPSADSRITFIEGDVMTYPFERESFDVITAVATLHHLPLKAALVRFRDLLRENGVLVVIGLHRARSLADYTLAAAAFPASWILRSIHGYAEVQAPVRKPRETLQEICSACAEKLPGATIRRHLLFRYSLVWRKITVAP